MARDADALLIEKWAADGTVQTPENAGVDRATGWDAIYSTPAEAGGKQPERGVVNQLFRELSALAVELNTRGLLEWDSSVSYVHPAYVIGSDIRIYVSGRNSTGVDPVTDTTHADWKPVIDTTDGAIGLVDRQIHILRVTTRDYLDQVDVDGTNHRFGLARDALTEDFYPIAIDFEAYTGGLTLASKEIASYSNTEDTVDFYTDNVTGALSSDRGQWEVPAGATKMRLSCGFDIDLRADDAGQQRYFRSQDEVLTRLSLMKVRADPLDDVVIQSKSVFVHNKIWSVDSHFDIVEVTPGEKYYLQLSVREALSGGLEAGELVPERTPVLIQGNQHPTGICPDTTRNVLWVANNVNYAYRDRIYPYNLTTGASLQAAIYLVASQGDAQGIAVSGNYLYVGDLSDRMIRCYEIGGTSGAYTLTHKPLRDIYTNRYTGSGSTTPSYSLRHPVIDIWIEGDLLWCKNHIDLDHIYAYRLSTRLRVSAEEVAIVPSTLFSNYRDAGALWKDGAAFWVGGADEIIKIDKTTGAELSRLSFGETASTDDQLYLAADANYWYLSDWRGNGTGVVSVRSRDAKGLFVLYPKILGHDATLIGEIQGSSVTTDSHVGSLCLEFW